MTNEEKASQIALEICGEPTEFDITGEYPCSEEAAMKMAEWKDQQFKELHNPAYSIGFADGRNVGTEETKQQFKEYLEKNRTNYPDFMSGDNDYTFGMREGYVQAFDKIAKELFKED